MRGMVVLGEGHMDDIQNIINEDKELFYSSILKKIDFCKKKLNVEPNNISIIRELAKYSSQIEMSDALVFLFMVVA